MALVSQPTLSTAARASGVGERTLRRWLHEDRVFQAAYRKLRSEAMRQAYARLQSACGEAVQTLRELLTLRKRPDVQARAALGILSVATRIEELKPGMGHADCTFEFWSFCASNCDVVVFPP